MILWKGSHYYRDSGNNWRNRNTGKIINLSKSASQEQLRRASHKSKSYELVRVSPYGSNPRSKIQTKRDSKSFHQKLPVNLSAPSGKEISRTPRVVNPRR